MHHVYYHPSYPTGHHFVAGDDDDVSSMCDFCGSYATEAEALTAIEALEAKAWEDEPLYESEEA